MTDMYAFYRRYCIYQGGRRYETGITSIHNVEKEVPMPARRNSRNKVRAGITQNIEGLGRMIDKVLEIQEMYIATDNHQYAAYIGQLVTGIELLIESHEKVYAIL